MPSDSIYLFAKWQYLHNGTTSIWRCCGIDNNTLVGFWFGVINHPTTPQFEIDLINGLPVASSPVLVGGETVKITFQMMSPMIMLQLIGP